MATKDDVSKEAAFPEGYEHFGEVARFTASRLREVEKKIREIPVEEPKQTSHRLRFDPPGLGRELRKWQNANSRKLLETHKEEIDQQAMAKMEKDFLTEGIDPETAAKIRTATIDTHHPNIFREMNEKELAASRHAQKDLNHSQNYMRTLLEKSRDKPRLAGKEKANINPKVHAPVSLPRALFSQQVPTVKFQNQSVRSEGGGNAKPKLKQPNRE
ncbi:hypothetical protein LZD49_18345 [Dyadobacter sp. CY261]|uniref:hypothetical protein n=1 Tax=Dyadobacter sp. CY261 TaxID=2907203 RepID=UPI001F240EBF|nr:hypothetical protein [Dyadobacter sp. CY261]MCF0072449.1 hypothetical protein [Dyadobacter sp. CY261]